jgi:serine O-acetyltransferase
MLFTRLREDIDNVFAKDPAARSVAEVILCYPGLHALWMHRIAHFFWRRRFRLLARFLSHISRFLTGIEIHPGAVIGRRFFIDHGSGVVVGETAEIGNDVLLYQGVVLGGTSLKKEKRHPTIGDGVVIGSGAVVLGAVTIGNNTKIGSGSVVVKSVPPGVTVIGVPGKVVKNGSKPAIDLEHGRLPDPVARAIDDLLVEQQQLKDRIKRLENLNNNAVLPDKGEVTLRKKEYELNRSGKL